MEDIPILRVNTLADENDGSAELGTGLSLRDAILIANSTPGEEIIELESEQIYGLTLEGIDPSSFDLILNPRDSALFGDLDIASTGGKLTIRGLGAGATIDGNQINRVIQVRGDFRGNGATLVLENITITGGRAITEDILDDGGGGIFIDNRATAELIDCRITDNSAANGGKGGGIANSGLLTVQNCTIDHNFAGHGGGISSSYAVTTIVDSTITNNTASLIGLGNVQIGSGGGVQHEGTGNTEITNSTITNNSAGFRGGGVIGEQLLVSRGSVSITNSAISDNIANFGGGVGSNGVESFTIENTTIENNTANGSGGGLGIGNILDEVTLNNSIVRNNQATGNGGGINAEGQLTIRESIVTGNTAGGDGGGVNSVLSTVAAFDSTFSNNTAGDSGGGLNNVELLINSTVSNNKAGSLGGGLFTLSPGIIINSTISGNETDSSGGGISIANSDGANTVLLANTTVSGNTAQENGGGINVGGGLIDEEPQVEVILFPANVVVTNSTIVENLSDSNNDGVGSGGGIYNPRFSRLGNLTTVPGDITLNNSIIAGNFDTPENNGVGIISPDISGAARGNANNLVGNLQGLTIEEVFVAPESESLGQGSDLSNIESSNLGLGILQDNGGLTQTHALLQNSPAINGGNNDNILRETFIDINGNGQPTVLNFDGDPNTTNEQIPFDQRGGSFSRLFGGTVDIGAFEVQFDV